MMARMSRSKTADEDVSAADRSNAAKAYGSIGIDLYDKNGQYQDLSVTLDQLASKWGSMTDAEKAYIAEQSAGTRGLNVFNTLMGNWDRIKQLAQDATTDTTFYQDVQERFNNSIAGAQGRLEASMQGFWNNVIDTSALSEVMTLGSGVVDVFTNIAGVVNDAVAAFTGFTGVGSTLATIASTGAVLATAFSATSTIGQILQGKSATEAVSTGFTPFISGFKYLGNLSKDLFGGAKNKVLGQALSQGVTQGVEDQAQLASLLGQSGAENTQAQSVPVYLTSLGKALNQTEWGKVFGNFKTGLKQGFNSLRNFGKEGQSLTDIFAKNRTSVESNGLGLEGGNLAAANVGAVLGKIALPIAGAALAYWGYRDLQNARADTAQRASSAYSEYQTNQQQLSTNRATINTIKGEYSRLAKGVNTYTNSNISLTNAEYERYLELTSQIATSFPSLVKGFDSTGNAILNTSNAVYGMNEALNQQTLQFASQNLSNASDYYSDFRFMWDSAWAGNGDAWQNFNTGLNQFFQGIGEAIKGKSL